MKIIKKYALITKQRNPKSPCDFNKNHENHRIPWENNKKYENHRVPWENHENNEKSIIRTDN